MSITQEEWFRQQNLQNPFAQRSMTADQWGRTQDPPIRVLWNSSITQEEWFRMQREQAQKSV